MKFIKSEWRERILRLEKRGLELFMLSSRLFVNMLSIRVAVEEVMRVGLEIRGERLLDVIRLMNSFVG